MPLLLYGFNGMLVTNIPYAKENFRVANYWTPRDRGPVPAGFTVHR
jgi:hypothetical protein